MSFVGPSASELALMVLGAQMDEGSSVMVFIVATAAVCLLVALILPVMLRRVPLSLAVLLIGLVGPALGIVGAIIGSGAMTLSGAEVRHTLLVAGIAMLAALWVGFNVARPVARDLDGLVYSIERLAEGERLKAPPAQLGGGIERLAQSVYELSRSLERVEQQREVADHERQAVVTAVSHDLRTPLAALRVDAIAPVAAQKSIQFKNKLDGPVLVKVDHHALGRVWRNLFDNAVRHAPAGTCVSVTASLDVNATPSTVTVEVVDQGDGFPDVYIPNAFDRFTQASASRSSGAGLGLSITQTLLAALGGEVEVFGGPGGRVAVTLPLARETKS